MSERNTHSATHIPSATISRLITYLRVISRFIDQGEERAYSETIATEAHVPPFLLRKDLAYFGSFGVRGSGYDLALLEQELRRILGLDRAWSAAIIGVGRLGQAVLEYPELGRYDFRIIAAFDTDPNKIGETFAGVPVTSMSELAPTVASAGIELVLLTVPGSVAQRVADQAAAAGVRGILNFTPVVLTPPKQVRVEHVDFIAGLKRLAFYLQNGSGTP